MKTMISLIAADSEREVEWQLQIKQVLQSFVEFEFEIKTSREDLGQIVIVDCVLEDLHSFLNQIVRTNRVVLLVTRDLNQVPDLIQNGKVDDILIAPFRTLEVYSKLRYCRQALIWRELMDIQGSYSEMIPRLHEDLSMLERLQKSKLPQRFPKVKGFKVSSRYLAGVKPGGDYFDLAEAKNAKSLSIILSHSSSYGLSSRFINILMRVVMKTPAAEVIQSGAVSEAVQKIYEELILKLGETDQLSLFYGVISRETQTLRWLNLGGAFAFLANANESFHELPSHGDPLSRSVNQISDKEGCIGLSPESRLVLVSSGFIESLGSPAAICKILDRFRMRDALDTLNELTYRVKTTLQTDEDFPSQDCTAIIFDADSRVVKLTRTDAKSSG